MNGLMEMEDNIEEDDIKSVQFKMPMQLRLDEDLYHRLNSFVGKRRTKNSHLNKAVREYLDRQEKEAKQ